MAGAHPYKLNSGSISIYVRLLPHLYTAQRSLTTDSPLKQLQSKSPVPLEKMSFHPRPSVLLHFVAFLSGSPNTRHFLFTKWPLPVASLRPRLIQHTGLNAIILHVYFLHVPLVRPRCM